MKTVTYKAVHKVGKDKDELIVGDCYESTEKIMSWLSKLFNFVPKEERDGICLDFSSPHWKVFSPKDFPSFLRALRELIPEGSILYLEGGTPREELKSFLETKSIPEVSHVTMGTIWSRPEVFHLPANSETISELADVAEHYAEPEVAIHFHVYKDNRVLLQWHDAFSDPMFISKEIPKEKVEIFCNTLSVEYEAYTGV